LRKNLERQDSSRVSLATSKKQSSHPNKLILLKKIHPSSQQPMRGSTPLLRRFISWSFRTGNLISTPTAMLCLPLMRSWFQSTLPWKRNKS